MWDLETGELRRTLDNHTDEVRSLAVRLDSVGLPLVALVVAMVMGEGLNLRALFAEGPAPVLQMVAFLTAVAGMIVLWRAELAGSILVLGGMAAFYAMEMLADGTPPSGWVFPVCFLPGILSLAAWSLNPASHTPAAGR